MATIESRVGRGIPMVFLVSFVFIATCVLVIFIRRWRAAKQSGGPFMAPFHISNGTFYIHVAFCFKNRRISIDFMRGRNGGGSRYFVRVEQKDGTTTMFFMGKSQTNDALLEQLSQVVKRYSIIVHQS